MTDYDRALHHLAAVLDAIPLQIKVQSDEIKDAHQFLRTRLDLHQYVLTRKQPPEDSHQCPKCQGKGWLRSDKDWEPKPENPWKRAKREAEERRNGV